MTYTKQPCYHAYANFSIFDNSTTDCPAGAAVWCGREVWLESASQRADLVPRALQRLNRITPIIATFKFLEKFFKNFVFDRPKCFSFRCLAVPRDLGTGLGQAWNKNRVSCPEILLSDLRVKTDVATIQPSLNAEFAEADAEITERKNEF